MGRWRHRLAAVPWRYLDSVTALASWSQAVYPAFCAAFAAHTGVDPEYTGNGLILIAPDEADEAQRWATQHRHALSLIDRDTFTTGWNHRRPNRPMRRCGCRTSARYATRAWCGHCVSGSGSSASTYAQAMRRDLLMTDGRCRGVRSTSGALEGDAVAVCAGAWSARVLADYAAPRPSTRSAPDAAVQRTAGTITRMVLESTKSA